MKIAIISDTHDNWPYIDKACQYFKKQGVNIMLHCGDVCAPATLVHLAKRFPGEIHWVLGNVDGDPYLMMRQCAEYSNLKPYGQVLGELTIADRRLAWQHYPPLAYGLAKTGKYDAVFYGHNHLAKQEQVEVAGNKILLANPGNLCDIKHPASLGIYETTDNTFQTIRLTDL